MRQSAVQLTLGLSLRKDEATFANFFSGSNSEIVTALKQTASGEGEKIIYLCGGRNQGCSHLLQACCHHAHRYGLRSVYLPLANLQHFSPEMLIGLENMDLVCLDDMQSIAELVYWEEAVFHLFNRLCEQGNRIVIAGSELPKALNLKLNDLTSRLSWGMVYTLNPLIDEEKIEILMMRARLRGMNLPLEVAKYILTHCERHMVALFHVLDELDNASLTAQRRLTIPFVKEVLQL